MAEVLLRIEGVNFDATMLDTTDISTVRGASFLYLEAVQAVEAAFAQGCLWPDVVSCRRLSAGGSVGLFCLTLKDDERQDDAAIRCERVRKTIEEWLAGGAPILEHEEANKVLGLCRHLSFVVDVVETSDDEVTCDPREPWQDDPDLAFLRDRERVTAANRLRQMRSPSVVVPRMPDDADQRWRVCAEDQVRPAAMVSHKAKGNCVSDSVFDRREHGRARKRGWYEDALKPTDLDCEDLEQPPTYFSYAQDFSEIADDAHAGKNLEGKVAVFYADGNSFSAAQDRFIRKGSGAEQQKHFDEILHSYRRHSLHTVLHALAAHKAALRNRGSTDEGEARPSLRLETLYAAGDEGIWVVPASMGWTLAATFFAEVCGLDPATGARLSGREWRIGDPAGGYEQLHVAAGLVFCHHTAPITRVQRLARELAEVAKAHDRRRSLLCYQVLESFDHIGRDVAGFRTERCPAGTSAGDFVLPGDRLLQVPEAVAGLRAILPRRQLKRLALALHGDGMGGRYAEALRRLETECPEIKDHLPPLRACFGDGPALWLHIDELWDFLAVPEKTDETDEAKAREAACAPGG